jgi:N-acetylmuramate 1-kinase
MISQHTFSAVDETGLCRLAGAIAFAVRPGDMIALSGELGAGKTTFARAFIAAMVHPDAVEVPSPTFTLVQTYATARMPVAHCDLYRVSDSREIGELGLEDAVATGVALVEWPERADGALPGTRLDLVLGDAADGTDRRDVAVHAHGTWVARLNRIIAIQEFLHSAGLSDTARMTYLQGDASVRRYARLHHDGGARAVLMDWPRQPDGPPIRNGLPYSRIAHLAEGVRPFVAIGTALAERGFSVPRLLAHNLDAGLLLIEDFGDRVFGAELRTGTAQASLWQAGVDALVALRAAPPPSDMPLPDGTTFTLPVYNQQALAIETELLIDWYWPALYGTPIPLAVRAEYCALWQQVLDRLMTMPRGWTLRDYHSPNLLWLPDRVTPRNVGIIDFQDAQSGPHGYDLVSLLQDARVDVPASLEADLLAHYCTRARATDKAFDAHDLRWSYAALGAQRNAKILGIFARLAHRDGKPQYLAHIPRIWAYLARDLAHGELNELKAWFDRAFPEALRHQPIGPRPSQSAPAATGTPA